MAQGLTLDQTEQVMHLSRLALLGMISRAVAAGEFETSPEVTEIHVSVMRPKVGGESVCELTICAGDEVQGCIPI